LCVEKIGAAWMPLPSCSSKPEVTLKARILHVDDDPDIRLLMAGSLQEFGYTVMTAGSVHEAMQLAREMAFDLCILDIRLPDGSGIELCQQLRGLQPGVPIVYYSAYADEFSQKKVLAVCGDAYLRKPTSMDEWERTITGLLAKRRP
jgi:DNA-binding response OmpR family regulator